MTNFFDLTGRVAVVVGATSGLGKSIACGLAEQGSQVAAAGRRSDAYPVDVSTRASIDALRDKILEQFGRVDILVNAAGITLKKPSATMEEMEWLKLFDTNLNGALRACQSFYEPLK